jgi:hypothetical protein
VDDKREGQNFDTGMHSIPSGYRCGLARFASQQRRCLCPQSRLPSFLNGWLPHRVPTTLAFVPPFDWQATPDYLTPRAITRASGRLLRAATKAG